jgi:hypothetical protein
MQVHALLCDIGLSFHLTISSRPACDHNPTTLHSQPHNPTTTTATPQPCIHNPTTPQPQPHTGFERKYSPKTKGLTLREHFNYIVVIYASTSLNDSVLFIGYHFSQYSSFIHHHTVSALDNAVVVQYSLFAHCAALWCYGMTESLGPFFDFSLKKQISSHCLMYRHASFFVSVCAS